MKSLYIADVENFSTGQPVSRALFAMDDVEVKTSATGAPYLRLTLADITGSLSAVMFDQETIPAGIAAGEPVLVSGVFSKDYNNIQVRHLEQYTGKIDSDDFLATSSRGKDEMYDVLVGTVAEVSNPHLRQLLSDIFNEPETAAKLKIWPGAKTIHHSFTGGLLEHTLAVVKLCETSVTLYDVDKDLTIAGALLHDIGKLQELELKLTVTYTDVGSLHGHSILGANLVRDRIAGVAGFPDQLREQLLHIILSHHGELEWGAITKPMTLEAFLVFMSDNTDAKANRYQHLIHQQMPLKENVGNRDNILDIRVYAPSRGES
ncbi:MAG: HD domain-containing protein [Dehalococcoidia bacterium]